jgi:hypothetical protein
MMGIKKSAECSADLKKAKCTYKKFLQKYMLNWDFHAKLAGIFEIAFYRCSLRLRFLIPMKSTLRKKNILTLVL